MIDEFRPRRGAALTLAFMLLLAGGSFWLLKQAQQPEQGASRRSAQGLPDYTMHQFRFTTTRTDGRADYLVEGDQLSHYPDRDETLIQGFRMTRYIDKRQSMFVSSDTANTNADHSQFHLHDHVVLRRPSASDGETLLVTSDYMLVLTNKDIVKSHRPVQAQQGGTTLKGTGMTADSKQQTLTLHSAVTATYLPPDRVRR
ncbi:MAG: LPS export ABC transporter periplasmic protein LptC [Betaproteobacteria bacterium]